MMTGIGICGSGWSRSIGIICGSGHGLQSSGTSSGGVLMLDNPTTPSPARPGAALGQAEPAGL